MSTVVGETRMSAPRARRRMDARTNLSSNELDHPAIPGLLRAMTAGFDPVTLRCYPEQQHAVVAAAEMLGLASEDDLVLGAGSDSLLRLIQYSLCEELGGRLILQWPNYEAWSVSLSLSPWQVTRVPTPGAQVAERMLPVVRATPQSLVVVSWPNGPGGYCPPMAELEQIRDACAESGSLLVVDACYAAFAPGSPFREAIGLAGPHCLVILSWSKMFGVAGGRLALAAGDPSLTHRLRLYRQEDHVNGLMLHVLRYTEPVLPEYYRVWRDIIVRREYIRSRIGVESGVSMPPSGGNFLHVPMPSAESAALLWKKINDAGFRVRNMLDTTGLENHVRFTVTVGHRADAFLKSLIGFLSEGPG